jgi:hypothetical protein
MIVQIEPFDITTASPHQILGSAGFWANLPRITKVNSARLLMVTDTLQPEEVVERFHAVAVPADVLPPGVRAYRMQYEMFLHQTVQAVRYMRLYLVLDAPALGEEGLLRLLGSYGIRARRLDGPVPRPFAAGRMPGGRWRRMTVAAGSCSAPKSSRQGQSSPEACIAFSGWISRFGQRSTSIHSPSGRRCGCFGRRPSRPATHHGLRPRRRRRPRK